MDRLVLENERLNLIDAITEIEADIRDDEQRERDLRAEGNSYRTHPAPAWNVNRPAELLAFADAAAARIATQRIRLNLRRQWLRGIDRALAKLAA